VTGDLRDLIKYRMSRARETLEEAHIMLESSHLFGAANRMYYACYYAVNALLIKEGYSASKHSGIRSLFNRNFIKPGIISIDAGVAFNTLYDFRQASDYRDFHVIEKESADELYDKALSLVDEIERHLSPL